MLDEQSALARRGVQTDCVSETLKLHGAETVRVTSDTNRQWLLESRPEGKPRRDSFRLAERPVPEPEANEVLVRTHYMSVDPYMRGRMGESQAHSETWPVGDPMRARVVGEVVESNYDDLSAGDTVFGMLDWAEYATAYGGDLQRIDFEDIPVSTALHVLGSPGRTAYVGTVEVGRVRPGDTVVVSAAAGAVGSVAGQIARIAGCRVVGIAGADEKTEWLTGELGFDAAINYKTADDLRAAIGEACPRGVDLYFENVGGEVSDAVLAHLAQFSRVAVCGKIALYNEEGANAGYLEGGGERARGPRRLDQRTRSRTEGFIISDYEHRFEHITDRLARWIRDGDIAYRETVTEGIQEAPNAFLGLFEGVNIGKQLVRVADPGE
jgi:NADPH-dependent curcumin reductase CurA